jgi:hypothetical protein
MISKAAPNTTALTAITRPASVSFAAAVLIERI